MTRDGSRQMKLRARQLLKARSFLDQVKSTWPCLLPSSEKILTDAELLHLLQSVILESGLSQYVHSRESTFTDAWESFLFAVENNKLDEALELLQLTHFEPLQTLKLYPLRYHEEALADCFFGDEAWGLLYEVLAVEISDYGWYMGEEWDSITFQATHVLAGAIQPLLEVGPGIAAVLRTEPAPDVPSLLVGLALRYGSADEGDPFIGHMFVEDEEVSIGWNEIPQLLCHWQRWKRLEKLAPNESEELTPAWLFGQVCQWIHTPGGQDDRSFNTAGGAAASP